MAVGFVGQVITRVAGYGRMSPVLINERNSDFLLSVSELVPSHAERLSREVLFAEERVAG
jgi:hypothetical protein